MHLWVPYILAEYFLDNHRFFLEESKRIPFVVPMYFGVMFLYFFLGAGHLLLQIGFNNLFAVARCQGIPISWWFYGLVQYDCSLIIFFTDLYVHIPVHASSKCHIYLLRRLLRRCYSGQVAIEADKILLSALCFWIADVRFNIFLAHKCWVGHDGIYVMFICFAFIFS